MNEVRIEKTGQPDVVSTSDGRLTLSVPIKFKRRGGRKVVMLPDGNTLEPRPLNDKPTPIQMALARGHRWLAMLESGEAESLTEVAEREGMDRAYVSRMVNLITLAPDIVAAILDETLPSEMTLFDLALGTPLLWDEQRAQIQPVCRVVSLAEPDD
jgi:1-acyl-sn-glycerol-3-phosphate acyltransferase